MHIEVASEANEDLLGALQRLIPQLASRPAPTWDELLALIRSECSSLLVARDEAGGRTVGIACLTVYRVPTGVRAIIEDVVVDDAARGRGIGEALTRQCLELAHARGAGAVTLTSNPSREAANRLYLRMGFTRRETNAYIYRFD